MESLISAFYASARMMDEELGFPHDYGRYVVHMNVRNEKGRGEVAVRIVDDGKLTCEFLDIL